MSNSANKSVKSGMSDREYRDAYIEMVDVVPYILSSGGVGGQVQVQKEEVCKAIKKEVQILGTSTDYYRIGSDAGHSIVTDAAAARAATGAGHHIEGWERGLVPHVLRQQVGRRRCGRCLHVARAPRHVPFTVQIRHTHDIVAVVNRV